MSNKMDNFSGLWQNSAWPPGMDHSTSLSGRRTIGGFDFSFRFDSTSDQRFGSHTILNSKCVVSSKKFSYS